MKTMLDRWLSTEPEDIDYPEQRSGESWYEFKLREWFYRATKDAKKSRESWGKGVVKK